CSGCVEVGAFGKEAYILTGYFNLPKILELTLNNGVDPCTDQQLGVTTGSPESFDSFEMLFQAFQKQFAHFLEIKMRGNQIIEQMYASQMPAPFLSVLTDDCISKGVDYNAGGARYNNTFIQMVGIGSLTDSLAALKYLVFEEKSVSMETLLQALKANFQGFETLQQQLLHKAPKYGNDEDRADDLMRRVFTILFEQIDGRPNAKGGFYRVEMLPTTSHVYFGSKIGAMPDGRPAGNALSEGISPVQGADRCGPTAVMKSAAKMDHLKTGGTLLNMKFTPEILESPEGIDKIGQLIRSYFRADGHHVQLNVVTAEKLRCAQRDPDSYRDLIVRVAGYSDYFCDLPLELQEEIIARTEHTI
ncbi:MAG: pyruvate formate lyase family protein, partial [Thermoguttaceae bacterium]